MNLKKKKILIVDDTKHVVVLLKHFCVKAGYSTIESYDGKDALVKIKEENPDLVLLDAMMPEMSGFEVCQSIRQNDKMKFLPVIMVTALCEIDDRIKALNIGVDDFLSKPVDELLLVTKIKSLLSAKGSREKLEKTRLEISSLLINDFKAPVKSMLDSIILLEKECSEQLGKYQIANIKNNCKNILEKIDDFLDYSFLLSGKLEINRTSGDIISTLNKCFDNLQSQFSEKFIQIQTNFPISFPIFVFDEHRIIHAISNLISFMLLDSPKNGIFQISFEKLGNNIIIEFLDFAEFDENLHFLDSSLERLVESENEEIIKKYIDLLFTKAVIEAHNGQVFIEKHSTDKRKIKIIVNFYQADKEKT